MDEEPQDSEYKEPAKPQQALVPHRSQGVMIPAAGEIVQLAQETSPYFGAGDLELTDAQVEACIAPFDDLQHDIKPTGEVFVPQIQYRIRLNQVFRPGGWAMIPLSEPKAKVNTYTTTITQKWIMIHKGRFVGEAWGEMDYNHKNANQTEATAIEGAKSNAVMRICKDLGMGSECWDKTFTTRFKKDFCVRVLAPNARGETKAVWRRKDRQPFRDEKPLPAGRAGEDAD